ncbi:hypothetical protein [Glycomyces paridis]|uniref:Uncharacterized protein n=1 Tax=Glycomyces paridis TaxID=2126555 RepID=A0A4S8PK83_9ACTN|nr:hypothetical protein [Glycomyces paridis]THV30125.1 hypothetical protein E9998_07035 [Glycomyces paridis]
MSYELYCPNGPASGFLRALVSGAVGRFRLVNAEPDPTGKEPASAHGFTSAHAVRRIGGRQLHFEAFPSQARLRITTLSAGTVPESALGSVIRLDTTEPGLRVSAPLEVEWASTNMEEIVAEAVRIWGSLARNCEG